MAVKIYFPHDVIGTGKPNFDLAADYLELIALFSDERESFTNDLINASEIGAEEDYGTVDEEMTDREEIVSGAVKRIYGRREALDASYPFTLDESGDVLA